jgi:hypothetical protein
MSPDPNPWPPFVPSVHSSDFALKTPNTYTTLLRDQFALRAMQSLVAGIRPGDDVMKLALAAYKTADSMLLAR